MKALLQRISRGIAEVCDAAMDMGIKVGAENHGRFVGGSEQIKRMIELVDRVNFGVNIDFTNFRNVFGEDPVAVTQELAPTWCTRTRRTSTSATRRCRARTGGRSRPASS